MWKAITGILFLFFPLHVSISAYDGTKSNHLAELKAKYSYGLLGEDYGVLDINDLALNACHNTPEPFVPGALNPYEYWLCFESKAIVAKCEDLSFSNEDGHVGRVVLDAQDHQNVYQFIGARPWPIRDCNIFAKSLKRLLKGTAHACISASYIGKEDVRMGIFHRLKSRKGCEGEECVLTEEAKRNYCH